jgi:plasmid maintenance system antidote protein VapI
MTVYERLSQQYTPEELAESFVFPHEFNKEQLAEVFAEMAEYRKNNPVKLSKEELVSVRLLSLKFQIKNYLNIRTYKPELDFSHFLKEYLKAMDVTSSQFANEIQIDKTQLSHLINNRRIPNTSLLVRLELHSGGHIPAVLWLKLLDRQREHQLENDHVLREREMPYVTPRIKPKPE